MKRFVLRICVTGVAVCLFTGCGKRRVALVAVKNQNTNSAALAHTAKPEPKPTPKPAPPVKEIKAGTLEYLDSKYGFRDVTFGQSETAISNLVLKSQDDARQLKTYTRTGDTLALDGVPLESIGYTFFQGRLCQVSLNWKMEDDGGGEKMTPASEIVPFCAGLYGTPRRRSAGKDGVELIWQGRRAQIILSEVRLPGVADTMNGGWAIAPSVTGQMIFESIPLRTAADASFASRTNGL